VLGIIGGSGLYELPELTGRAERQVETPYGPPSDRLITGRLGQRELVFLPRHGRGHRLSPSEINFRANIYALKALGCDAVLSISAVGSLREDIRPGELVIVDQFVDRTRQRPATFFGGGVVGHVSLADPVCASLTTSLKAACDQVGAIAHGGGTYVCIEGPQFSTRAESNEYRALGASVIGMTNAPEYRLAREAGLCYATLALATDYDCWRDGDPVTVDVVLAVVKQNIARARAVIAAFAPKPRGERGCPCRQAAMNAVLTDPAAQPADAAGRLAVILR
jgi:5'-methylthioadenosine phosphorylase